MSTPAARDGSWGSVRVAGREVGLMHRRGEAENPRARLVRLYVRTLGRTRARRTLALEALVATSVRGQQLTAQLSAEYRAICELCRTRQSVADVVAQQRLPLGIVRVLIDDLAELGLVNIHHPATTTEDRPSIELMQRVLHGLHNL